jgi:hypothetical protein
MDGSCRGGPRTDRRENRAASSDAFAAREKIGGKIGRDIGKKTGGASDKSLFLKEIMSYLARGKIGRNDFD